MLFRSIVFMQTRLGKAAWRLVRVKGTPLRKQSVRFSFLGKEQPSRTPDALRFDMARPDSENPPSATKSRPHSKRSASAKPAHAAALSKASATKWCCTAGLHPENRKSVTATPERKPVAFRATDCNTGSAKRCVIRAFREFWLKCRYRIYSRGESACLGCCRASAVLD